MNLHEQINFLERDKPYIDKSNKEKNKTILIVDKCNMLFIGN